VFNFFSSLKKNIKNQEIRIEEKIKILLNIRLVKKTKEIFFITPPPSDLFSKKKSL
jgi:hypothetical protein